MNVNRYQGMTLVEVLAALVLLSIVAAACTSTLRGAFQSLESIRVIPGTGELSIIADDAAALCHESTAGLPTETPMELSVDCDDGSVAVVLIATVDSGEPSSGTWIRIELGDESSFRWIPKPESEVMQ
ncbi:MAG: type II secretion system protein [Planctomycetota bacterium]